MIAFETSLIKKAFTTHESKQHEIQYAEKSAQLIAIVLRMNKEGISTFEISKKLGMPRPYVVGILSGKIIPEPNKRFLEGDQKFEDVYERAVEFEKIHLAIKRVSQSSARFRDSLIVSLGSHRFSCILGTERGIYTPPEEREYPYCY